jgi:hypothetical protein
MPINTWSSELNFIHAGTAGAAYATSTTLTDVSPAPQFSLAAYQLTPGSTLRLTAFGSASNTGTPTLLLGFYYGGVAGIALAATTAITTTTAMTNWAWRLEYTGVVRTAGTAGSIMGSGRVEIPTSLTALTIRRIPEVAPRRRSPSARNGAPRMRRTR